MKLLASFARVGPREFFHPRDQSRLARARSARFISEATKRQFAGTERVADNMPKAAAWLDTTTDLGAEYWEGASIRGAGGTLANHQSIHSRFLERTESEKNH